MKKITIIDASVAIKWFVIEESGQAAAMATLDRIQDSPQHFAVPELFFNEMLSVLCKLLDDEKKIQEYMFLLESLGLTRIGNGSELISLAATIAVKHKLSGYDAIYAAAANLVDGHWLTADARAHKRIERMRISQLL